MVILSATAAARIAALAQRQGNPALKLRLAVEGGGCSGFQYRFSLTPDVAADDLLVETDGVGMVIDPISLPFLQSATVDYVTELGAAAFKVRNPDATASCGCGASFAL